MEKCSNIHNTVLLRQTLRRWRSRAAARAAADDGAVSVPAGHVAVCVGGASRRFVVRAAHLNHPVFRELLRQSEEEYGFPSGASGPVALPCGEDRLRDVLRRVSSSDSEERPSFRRRRGASHAGVARPVRSHIRVCLAIERAIFVDVSYVLPRNAMAISVGSFLLLNFRV